jgi:hypothetical protein
MCYFCSPTWIFLFVRMKLPHIDNRLVQPRKVINYISIIRKKLKNNNYVRRQKCIYFFRVAPAAWQRNNLLNDTMKAFFPKECINSRIGIKRISYFVQAPFHPVPCSTTRLVNLSKTLHLPSDISCKMARIMVIAKTIYRVNLQNK